MAESFWKIPSQPPTGVPLQMLREQADKLTEETGYALRGEVETFAFGNDLTINMSIRVPKLNDYVVEILSYRQSLHIFPGSLRLTLSNQAVEIKDYAQFVEAVKGYLSSEPMGRIVGSLLAQANV